MSSSYMGLPKRLQQCGTWGAQDGGGDRQLRSAICVCHFLVAVAINVATAAAAKLDIFTNLDIWYRQTGLRNSLLWCKNLRWEAGRNGNLVVEIVGTSSQSLRCTVRCSCPACSENFMLFNYSVV